MNMVKQSFIEWITKQEESVRIANYKIYEDYYAGDHETQIPNHIKAALESDYGITVNYCKRIIDYTVQYLISNKLIIKILPDESTPQIFQDTARNLLYSVYEDWDNDLIYLNAVKLATILSKKGDVFIKLYLAQDLTGEPGWTLNQQEIRVRVLRPELCFPSYKSDDYEDMQSCTIKYFDINAEGEPQWKAQVYYNDRIEFWKLFDIYGTERSNWEFESEESNPLGIIPIIHIKNSADDLEYGVSDLHIVKDVQDLANKVITDMTAQLDSEAWRTIWLFGHQSPKGFKWDLKPGVVREISSSNARVEYTPNADIAALLSAWETTVETIANLSQVPRTALMKTEGMPVSGFALRVHHIPLDMKCNLKKAIITNALKKLNYIIFRVHQLLTGEDFTNLKTDILFPDPLPFDDAELTQTLNMQVQGGLKSRQTAMEELGIEDVDAEMQKIAEDQEDVYRETARIRTEQEATRRTLEEFIAAPAPEAVPEAEQKEV